MSDAQKVEAGQVEDTVIVTVNGKVKYNGPALEFKGLAWTEIAPTPDPRDAVIEAARKVFGGVVALRSTERAERMFGPCGANDAGKVIAYRVGAVEMSELNGACLALEAALAALDAAKAASPK